MQEKLDKIEKMETIIGTDYNNMAGIVVMKDGKARNILLREAKRQYRISRSETCLP